MGFDGIAKPKANRLTFRRYCHKCYRSKNEKGGTTREFRDEYGPYHRWICGDCAGGR